LRKSTIVPMDCYYHEHFDFETPRIAGRFSLTPPSRWGEGELYAGSRNIR